MVWLYFDMNVFSLHQYIHIIRINGRDITTINSIILQEYFIIKQNNQILEAILIWNIGTGFVGWSFRFSWINSADLYFRQIKIKNLRFCSRFSFFSKSYTGFITKYIFFYRRNKVWFWFSKYQNMALKDYWKLLKFLWLIYII